MQRVEAVELCLTIALLCGAREDSLLVQQLPRMRDTSLAEEQDQAALEAGIRACTKASDFIAERAIAAGQFGGAVFLVGCVAGKHDGANAQLDWGRTWGECTCTGTVGGATVVLGCSHQPAWWHLRALAHLL